MLALAALIGGSFLLGNSGRQVGGAPSEPTILQPGGGAESSRAQVGTSAATGAGRSKLRHNVAIALLASGFALLLIVAGFELARRRREQWPPIRLLYPLATSPLPLDVPIVWISIEPQAQRRMKIGRALGAAVLVAYALGNLWIVKSFAVGKPFGRVVLVVALVLTTLVTIGGFMGLRAMRKVAASRIGITRDEVLFDPGNGKVERSHLGELRVGSTSVLIGRRIVPVIDPWRRSFFSRDQIEGYLLSRLAPSAFLKEGRLHLEALRRGNIQLRAAVIGAIVCIALTFLLEPIAKYLSSFI